MIIIALILGIVGVAIALLAIRYHANLGEVTIFVFVLGVTIFIASYFLAQWMGNGTLLGQPWLRTDTVYEKITARCEPRGDGVKECVIILKDQGNGWKVLAFTMKATMEPPLYFKVIETSADKPVKFAAYPPVGPEAPENR